jgi:hypothetical protein
MINFKFDIYSILQFITLLSQILYTIYYIILYNLNITILHNIIFIVIYHLKK